MIKIKPHHFLDIIKLYGAGYSVFIPDLKFKHDFYRIGNIILQDHSIMIQFTIGSDDICKPCVFLNKGKCSDIMSNNSLNLSKELWNKNIDQKILHELNLNNNDILSAFDFCLLTKKKLKAKIIRKIWNKCSKKELDLRIFNLQKGIIKYLKY